MKNLASGAESPGEGDGRMKYEPTMNLVRKAQRGDNLASEALFGRYSDRVLEIVRIRLRAQGRLRRKEQSLDLMQQSLLEALKGLDSFEMHDESSLIRWLSRVVERVLLNRLDYYEADKRNMDREVSIEPVGHSASEETRPFDPEAREPGPGSELRSEEHRAIVRECLASLPERYREVILMRDYEDVPWPEVVERLAASSEGAARMLHLRAIEKLGEALKRRGITGPVSSTS